MLSGGCQCGKVRYEADGEPAHVALCHCRDCQRSSGAPVVGWLAVKEGQMTLTSGELSTFVGPTGSQRQFCSNCGTGLFFRNEDVLPGIVDIQLATLADPAGSPPQVEIQVAERISWMEDLSGLPKFERFPGG